MIRLGDIYRDIITGFTGVAVSCREYLSGKVRIVLRREDRWHDRPEKVSFAEGRLEFVGPGSAPPWSTIGTKAGLHRLAADFQELKESAEAASADASRNLADIDFRAALRLIEADMRELRDKAQEQDEALDVLLACFARSEVRKHFTTGASDRRISEVAEQAAQEQAALRKHMIADIREQFAKLSEDIIAAIGGRRGDQSGVARREFDPSEVAQTFAVNPNDAELP